MRLAPLPPALDFLIGMRVLILAQVPGADKTHYRDNFCCLLFCCLSDALLSHVRMVQAFAHACGDSGHLTHRRTGCRGAIDGPTPGSSVRSDYFLQCGSSAISRAWRTFSVLSASPLPPIRVSVRVKSLRSRPPRFTSRYVVQPFCNGKTGRAM